MSKYMVAVEVSGRVSVAVRAHTPKEARRIAEEIVRTRVPDELNLSTDYGDAVDEINPKEQA